ncbi:helix-turn-helix transcriptional regulator [Amycolatopsis alkalitolerans]|nr:helix-turn-helix transcriptional regulator [Amycolatopsis alkalitolerans]
MTALGVSYLGDRAHHERFARDLAQSASLRWTGSPNDADIVLLDTPCTAVAGAAFLVVCPRDEPSATLPPGIRGVISCAATSSARLLALAAGISDVVAPRPLLSTVEIEVLSCAAAGLNLEDTARKLDLTTAGARSALTSAKRKLGARTRANAVALALRHGLLR